MRTRANVSVCTLAVAAAALGLAAPRPARASSALHVEGQHFVDDTGRVVVLRGVNVAGNAKIPPFRPLTEPAVFDPLPAWGMNVVRLLFTWEAYEPSPGAYDASYLDYYVSAVDAAASRGLFVIVDFHQDAFSRFSVGGCGEGFPAWAVPPSVTRAVPDNSAACTDWGTRMLTDFGMHASWHAFHTDADGVRSRFVAMVESVARRLVGRRAVIGYDIMNEPWGDEATEIHALHEVAGAAIRRADPSAILFVSPHALISAGGRSSLARPSFGNFAYSPHFYDGGVMLGHSWSGSRPDGSFANMRSVADAWGVPLFVGEFGAHADTTNGAAYVAALYDGLDATLASGAQWVYTPGWTPAARDGWNAEDLSIVDDTGATRAIFVARPYPRRIAGTPARFAVTGTLPADRVVELAWDNAPARGETELYLPTRALFGGLATAVELEGAQLACVADESTVRCASPSAGAMRVRVRAAGSTPPPPPPSSGCTRAGADAIGLAAIALVATRRRRRKR